MSHTPSIVDHARVTVMTFTSPPSLPLSRPWAGWVRGGIQHLCARNWTQVDIKGEKGFFGNPDWDPAHFDDIGFRFRQMSSVRSTSDGRGGSATRKRVPDREEPGKPRKDARRGRCHLLEAGFWPLWMTPLPRYPSHQVTKSPSLLREKRLKKIRASGGRPGRGLRWGLVCFPEVLLIFEDSLAPAPPVCTPA